MFATGLAVAAASSGFIIVYSLGASPMLHELAAEKFPVVDGYIEIPDRPRRLRGGWSKAGVSRRGRPGRARRS